MLRAGLCLLIVGLILGLVGDYPIDSPRAFSPGLMLAGGFMLAFGVTLVLWSSGARGGRSDEPSGFIRP